jgi:hypothetical protein
MAETKAEKWEVLNFIDDREFVASFDLVERFGYTSSYAAKRLSVLKSQGLVFNMSKELTVGRGCWALTPKGLNRLHYLCHKKMKILTDKEKREQEIYWSVWMHQEKEKPFPQRKIWYVENGKIRGMRKGDMFGVTLAEAREALEFIKEISS